MPGEGVAGKRLQLTGPVSLADREYFTSLRITPGRVVLSSHYQQAQRQLGDELCAQDHPADGVLGEGLWRAAPAAISGAVQQGVSGRKRQCRVTFCRYGADCAPYSAKKMLRRPNSVPVKKYRLPAAEMEQGETAKGSYFQRVSGTVSGAVFPISGYRHYRLPEMGGWL